MLWLMEKTSLDHNYFKQFDKMIATDLNKQKALMLIPKSMQ